MRKLQHNIFRIAFATLLLALLSIESAFGQQYESVSPDIYSAVLKEIEINSTTLGALREEMEAQKLGNRTGIFLANPEVEFAYLWGDPVSMGKRTDFSVSQSFDFPTAYGHRNRVAKLKNESAELNYKSERMDLLLTAKQICVELVYYNALSAEYNVRLKNAEAIANSYERRLAAGDANILESNKAKLNLITVKNEVARINIEQAALLSGLKRLNGGKELNFSHSKYPGNALPMDFESWYGLAEQKNPVLSYVKGEVEINRSEAALNRALSLPKLHAGYMSESVVGEKFSGITVGISIPLWENKNTVKEAQARVKASEMIVQDSRISFYGRLQSLYKKASELNRNATDYRSALSSYSNDSLLRKALDSGEISLLEYLLELEFYYDAVNNMLEAERDYELSLAELSAVEL
jgi:Outer membrane protein